MSTEQVEVPAGSGTAEQPSVLLSNSIEVADQNGESSKAQIQTPLHETMLQRVSTIKEGDNVLLRMPSDMVKAVVASKDG
jgi:hypothetical protein